MDLVWVYAILLGVAQGLCEFLPISSSGHLALLQKVFPGLAQPLLLDIMLHVGTLVAVLIYFRTDLLGLLGSAVGWVVGSAPDAEAEEDRRLILGLIVAQVPTAVIGLLLKDRVELMLGSAVAVGIAMLVTALLLVVGEELGKRVFEVPGWPGIFRSAVIGVVQGIAVVPGLSRSGSTIAAARALGISGARAAKYSFLISLPAVGGAALLEGWGKRSEIGAFTPGIFLSYMVLGPVVAGVVGYLVIGLMIKLVAASKLSWFAPYLLLVGGAAIWLGS